MLTTFAESPPTLNSFAPTRDCARITSLLLAAGGHPMGISSHQFQEMLARTQRNMKRKPPADIDFERPFEAVTNEVGRDGLHQKIIEHCDKQWPRWKYIHSRTDRKSTIGVGVHDFTVYLPKGRILNVECKAKDTKLTEEQAIWIKELEMLEHPVHIVRSLAEFIAIAERTLSS